MPLSFPNPSISTTYFYNGKSWAWNGKSWINISELGYARPTAKYTSSETYATGVINIDASRVDYAILNIDNTSEIYLPSSVNNYSELFIELNYTPISNRFDIGNLSYDNLFGVFSDGNTKTSLAFGDNGNYAYLSDVTTGNIYQYDLAIPWDITGKTLVSTTAMGTGGVRDLLLHPDGNSITWASGSAGLKSAVLTTDWDVSSFTSTTTYASLTNVTGLAYNSDGTSLYVLVGTTIYEYAMTTAYDTSTLLLGIINQITLPTPISGGYSSLWFNEDYTEVYLTDTGNSLYLYTMNQEDIGSIDTVNPQEPFIQHVPEGIAFDDFGTKMYIVESGTNTVYQYTAGEITSYPITWSSNIVWINDLPPYLDYMEYRKILLEFVMYDQGTWIGSVVSFNASNV